MPSTYTPIATITANGSASDYAFTSISAAYTDLILVANVRGAKTGATATCLAYLGDSTGYLQSNQNSVTQVKGDGSATNSSRTTNASGLSLLPIPAASATANVFSNIIINLQNYSNSTTYKTALWRANDANSLGTQAGVGLVRTTNPITIFGIATYGDGNFASGSTFTLYGVKSA